MFSSYWCGFQGMWVHVYGYKIDHTSTHSSHFIIIGTAECDCSGDAATHSGRSCLPTCQGHWDWNRRDRVRHCLDRHNLLLGMLVGSAVHHHRDCVWSDCKSIYRYTYCLQPCTKQRLTANSHACRDGCMHADIKLKHMQCGLVLETCLICHAVDLHTSARPHSNPKRVILQKYSMQPIG